METISEISHVDREWPANVVRLPDIQAVDSFRDLPDAANYSVHEWTGVDKVHESGNFGQGIKIGVVDTGIDYTHEAVSPDLSMRVETVDRRFVDTNDGSLVAVSDLDTRYPAAGTLSVTVSTPPPMTLFKCLLCLRYSNVI